MVTYSVTAAFDVSCYINREIEADSPEDATKKLKALVESEDLWSNWSVEYAGANEHRIIELQDPMGVNVLCDVDIDSDEWRALP